MFFVWSCLVSLLTFLWLKGSIRNRCFSLVIFEESKTDSVMDAIGPRPQDCISLGLCLVETSSRTQRLQLITPATHVLSHSQ